jgi:hypothetical protein
VAFDQSTIGQRSRVFVPNHGQPSAGGSDSAKARPSDGSQVRFLTWILEVVPSRPESSSIPTPSLGSCPKSPRRSVQALSWEHQPVAAFGELQSCRSLARGGRRSGIGATSRFALGTKSRA